MFYQTLAAGFELFLVVETSRFVSFLHVGQYTSPIVSCTLLPHTILSKFG